MGIACSAGAAGFPARRGGRARCWPLPNKRRRLSSTGASEHFTLVSGQLEKADVGRDYGPPTVRISPSPKVMENYRLTASQQGMFPSLGSDIGEDPNVFVGEPAQHVPTFGPVTPVGSLTTFSQCNTPLVIPNLSENVVISTCPVVVPLPPSRLSTPTLTLTRPESPYSTVNSPLLLSLPSPVFFSWSSSRPGSPGAVAQVGESSLETVTFGLSAESTSSSAPSTSSQSCELPTQSCPLDTSVQSSLPLISSHLHMTPH